MGRKPQSKLMSRRTERSYKADGADKLAPHSQVRCSTPEVNDPAAQQEFTFLLREICASGTATTPGAAIREDRCGSAEVSRGHSTESHEPGHTPEGLTTREGLNLADARPVAGRRLAMKPNGRAEVPRQQGRGESAATSFGTARNRRTRTRMSGGVGGKSESYSPTPYPDSGQATLLNARNITTLRTKNECTFSRGTRSLDARYCPSLA